MRLGAANAGVRDLQNMLTWWSAQSLVDRRTRHAKAHAVGVVESALLAFTCAGQEQLTEIEDPLGVALAPRGSGSDDAGAHDGGGRDKKDSNLECSK